MCGKFQNGTTHFPDKTAGEIAKQIDCDKSWVQKNRENTIKQGLRISPQTLTTGNEEAEEQQVKGKDGRMGPANNLQPVFIEYTTINDFILALFTLTRH